MGGFPSTGRRRPHRIRRFTGLERQKRIQKFIYTRTRQGKLSSLREIARHESLSLRQTKHHIEQLNKKLQKLSHGLESVQTCRKGKSVKYVYVQTPPPEPPKAFQPRKGDLVVRLYLDYESEYKSRNIEIQSIAVTPHDPWIPIMQDPVVVATVKRMRDRVAYVLGKKLADMLDIGFYMATPLSHNESWYRHGSGPKVPF